MQRVARPGEINGDAFDKVGLESYPAFFHKRRQRLIAEYEILPDITPGLQAVAGHVGAPYDDAEPLRVLWRRWRGRRGLRGTPGKPWVCVQLVMAADSTGVIPEWRSIDPLMAAPGDLLRAAEANAAGSFRRVR